MGGINLAVDVHNGDLGSEALMQGVFGALDVCDPSVHFFVCGIGEVLHALIDKYSKNHLLVTQQISVVDCKQNICFEEKPLVMWRKNIDSAIIRCILMQKEGIVQASLSAGDTRILMSAALLHLGRQYGVKRPALAALLPTVKTHPLLLLDVGANIACKVDHLVSFGQLGFKYIQQLYDKKVPTVMLLNIGKEKSKGTRVIRETAKVLSKQCPGFKGFIEGDAIFGGEADVVVCDGFCGNILLKSFESFHKLIASLLLEHNQIIQNVRRSLSVLNPDAYGAVPLLGLQGTVLKAHGASSATAFTHALLTAVHIVEQDKNTKKGLLTNREYR